MLILSRDVQADLLTRNDLLIENNLLELKKKNLKLRNKNNLLSKLNQWNNNIQINVC